MAVLGLEPANRADDHIVLESPGYQLVVHRSVRHNGSSGGVHGAVRRSSAAFKPVFFVPSITSLRTIAAAHGGVVEPVEHEWRFSGATVCDGVDPEGNVIQFRELAAK
jgi:hypothetical protein